MILPDIHHIKARRKQLGLTQRKLAMMSGISQSLIAKIESGKAEASYNKIKTIFKILDNLTQKTEKKCKEIMTTSIISIKENNTVGMAVKLMKKHEISQLPVFDNNTKVTGSITETTILKAMENTNRTNRTKDELFKQKIKQIQEEAFPIVNKQTPINSIIPLLKNVPAVLVSEKGKIVGIISKVDVL